MSLEQDLENMTTNELLKCGREELLRVGIEEAQEECERMLMHLLSYERSELYLKIEEKVGAEISECFMALLQERKKRIPLAYLLREADFWQETLYVTEQCLVPRPETEILVENILKMIQEQKKEKFSFLDIGTGSGAIAVAVLHACEEARGTLLDVSTGALDIARENVKKYALEDRAELVRGDLFEPFQANDMWDVIVSNPPYLALEDWEQVQPELKFEPREALDGGKDGLDFYRRIILEAKNHLVPGGMVALEVGQGQTEMVSKWLQEAGYDNIQRFKDHLHIERVVIANKRIS